MDEKIIKGSKYKLWIYSEVWSSPSGGGWVLVGGGAPPVWLLPAGMSESASVFIARAGGRTRQFSKVLYDSERSDSVLVCRWRGKEGSLFSQTDFILRTFDQRVSDWWVLASPSKVSAHGWRGPGAGPE